MGGAIESWVCYVVFIGMGGFMNSADRNEMLGAIMNLRNEVWRQMGQFERDKVAGEDERARGFIISLNQRVTQLEGYVAGLQDNTARMDDEIESLDARASDLERRVTLCEGRIGRLEAKP